MRVEALVFQALAVFDPKAVLFINTDQTQAILWHTLGDQRMRANHQINLAIRNSLQNAPPFFCSQAAG